MNSSYYFANRFSMLPNNTDFLPYDINVLKKIQEESERRKRPKPNYSFHTLFSPFIADAVGASPNYDIEAKAVELLRRKKIVRIQLPHIHASVQYRRSTRKNRI